jgi:hypothetical protein
VKEPEWSEILAPLSAVQDGVDLHSLVDGGQQPKVNKSAMEGYDSQVQHASVDSSVSNQFKKL